MKFRIINILLILVSFCQAINASYFHIVWLAVIWIFIYAWFVNVTIKEWDNINYD
jgi:hypothetical protein